MRIRRSIILLCVVVFVVTVLILWRGQKRPVETSLSGSAATNVAPSAVTMPIAPLHTNVPAAQITASALTATGQPQFALPQDRATLIKNILQGNDADIIFYGRLEDQSGSAIFGAAINFSIQYEDANSSGIHRGQVMSDGNGFFTISGYKGQTLGIMPQKAGYTLATTGTSFRYSQLTPGYFVPDPNRPTVIQMWKLQGAEPLVNVDEHYKLPYIGTPINFDLLTGKIVQTGGDLEVIVTRSPGIITQKKQDHGDWSIKLLPVNGGIMEPAYNTSYLTFEAPADGYQDNYFIQMNHDDPGWYDNIQQAFFLTSRNGQVYSKFSFYFRINGASDGSMYFQFKGVANANGSRNWEATAPQ